MPLLLPEGCPFDIFEIMKLVKSFDHLKLVGLSWSVVSVLPDYLGFIKFIQTVTYIRCTDIFTPQFYNPQR